jgi:hypothetical protein
MVPKETPSSAGTMPSLFGEDFATEIRFRWPDNCPILVSRRLLSLFQPPVSTGERETTAGGEGEESCTCQLTRAGWRSSLAA